MLIKIVAVVRAWGLIRYAGQGEWARGLTDWLKATESQPGRPLWLNPLSDLSEPSHHTQLLTVKNRKKQTEKHTGHYVQAVGPINHSLNQFREKLDKKLRSPLRVLCCNWKKKTTKLLRYTNMFEVGLELISYLAAELRKMSFVFTLKSV